ncbi:hypothetical protein HMPREF1008_00446 [Olsenella sp. oral taxon 809 str. F0356]|uniref:hypothetical protein n=1 Tax=Olsenella sp. oral taxon 809 TaxID=661086 RepID=UPI000231EC6E|nr:hypothetical protein [Olsenella sp. oral taxon 809]EHF02801.1 hypothetical protein HMPREF1008_00446 [Olsenella sp. oral taxon 809 str. F0356]
MNNVRKAGLGLAGAIAAATVVATLGGRGLGVPASGGRQAPAAQEQVRVLRQDDPASKADVSFATDDTTEVLIDAPEVDSDQIVKVVKHGDHWHIFTKDGREIITYSDPSALYPHAYVGEYSGSHSDHGRDGGQGARVDWPVPRVDAGSG